MMIPRVLALLAVLARHWAASESKTVGAQQTYKRDKITGTVTVDGLLAKRPVDVDLYVYYVPRLDSTNNSCAIKESKDQCESHECKSADPTYYNVFQLDKEPDVTSTCKKGMILCLTSPLVLSPQQQQEFDMSFTKIHNWTKPCTDAGYRRAIRVTATETQWILEVGHQFFEKNASDPNKPILLNGTLELQRSADGHFVFNNVFLKKIEGNHPITSPNPTFAHAYERYFMDAGSPCVSKVHGAILPHKIRVIGSTDCHMSVTFIGDLTPYSVAGRICELEWAELYSCNNGGGLRTRKCDITVLTGIRNENQNDSNHDSTRTGMSRDDETTQIDQTVENSETLEKSLKVDAEMTANIPIEFLTIGGSLKGGLEDKTTSKESVTDLASKNYQKALEQSKTLTESEKQMAKKVTFNNVNMHYVIRTPPGWYQAVMTLKMTCGRSHLYPGFVDIRARPAESTEWMHEYHSAGALPEANMTENELEVEKQLEEGLFGRVPTTTVEPVATTVDDGSIVGNVAELLKDLLYFWKDLDHDSGKSRRVTRKPSVQKRTTNNTNTIMTSTVRSTTPSDESSEECDAEGRQVKCRMALQGRVLCGKGPAAGAEVIPAYEDKTFDETCWTWNREDTVYTLDSNGSFHLQLTTTSGEDCSNPWRIFLDIFHFCGGADDATKWSTYVYLPEAYRTSPENGTLKWYDMGEINLKLFNGTVVEDYDECKVALRGRVVCAGAPANGTELDLTIKRDPWLPHSMISEGVAHPKANDSGYFKVVIGAYMRVDAENRYTVTFFHQCRPDGFKRFSNVDLPETYQPSVANETLNWYDMGTIELTKVSSKLITEYKAEIEPQSKPDVSVELLTES